MMEKQSCIKWIQPGSFYRQKQVRFIKVLQKMLKLKTMCQKRKTEIQKIIKALQKQFNLRKNKP